MLWKLLSSILKAWISLAYTIPENVCLVSREERVQDSLGGYGVGPGFPSIHLLPNPVSSASLTRKPEIRTCVVPQTCLGGGGGWLKSTEL